jgi:hypothetical protein
MITKNYIDHYWNRKEMCYDAGGFNTVMWLMNNIYMKISSFL